EYTEEFHNLASRVDWQEDILVYWFKDGLNNNLYMACLACGAPNLLHEWYLMAEEVEIDMAHNQYRSGRAWRRSPPQGKFRPSPNPEEESPTPQGDLSQSESNLEDNPIRLGKRPNRNTHSTPKTVYPQLREGEEVAALLDLGCIRCLINPTLV
ncbi:hypothetical protein E2320_022811, partial [Naja naja]